MKRLIVLVAVVLALVGGGLIIDATGNQPHTSVAPIVSPA